MRSVSWSELDAKARTGILRRPRSSSNPETRAIVASIISDVQHRGDEAVLDYSKRFDQFNGSEIRVAQQVLDKTVRSVSSEAREALEKARSTIQVFHQQQLQPDLLVETAPGVSCRLVTKPVDSVGLYIPGGTAPLVSSVLMMGVPAAIAGCRRVILCSPPPISNEIIYAATMCGIEEIYQVGGAQAIAAMAYGTSSMPPVNKIFGPGNSYVTEAKRQVSMDPDGAGIDMVAGPTELMLIADVNAHPEFVAADLLAQAEHGADSQVILVSPSDRLISDVLLEIEKQVDLLPRNTIATAALAESIAIECRTLEDAIDIANSYAPEHLSIQADDAALLAENISSAGSIFLGDWSPESAGDYATGTNHVLPTHGSARFSSGLTVRDFQKTTTIQSLTKKGLQEIGRTIEVLASLEELEGHKRAVTIRLDAISNGSTQTRETGGIDNEK